MKTSIILLFALTLISQIVYAEEIRTADDIIALKETKRFRYILKTELLQVIVLNMNYGDSYVISEIDRAKLKNADVQLIDLVFTDFPKGEDLKALNLSRIKVVESLRKSLVTDVNIRWRIIRQSDCKNEGEAKTFFHGIVIHYKLPQTEEDRLAEVEAISKFLPEESTLKSPKEIRKSLVDSTIVKVFERKKAWSDMTVVADLTGSMAPYTAQLVLWFKLKVNDKRIKDLVFFNDGDKTPDDLKVIGSTGGIYHTKATNYGDVRKLAVNTIVSGCGGDMPENNIEALLFAISKAPATKDFIMVADNTANVKDLILLKDVHKPIHIILCGSRSGINPDYLNIARSTGGSVHTMEADLEDLIKKNEGDKFFFMGELFVIKNGVVVKVFK
ncbi:MAG: hypothetical protein RI883_1517 [Bacteroidota bacterium]|jgi:hypothetical protein